MHTATPAPAAKQFYAVVPHAERGVVTGRGFVVRTCNEALQVADRHNYSGVRIYRRFLRRSAAEKYAAKLSA